MEERAGAEVVREGVGNTGVGILLCFGEEEEDAGVWLVEGGGSVAWMGGDSTAGAVGFTICCWVIPEKGNKKMKLKEKLDR